MLPRSCERSTPAFHSIRFPLKMAYFAIGGGFPLRTQRNVPRTVVYRSHGLARMLRLPNLWIAFNGFWPYRSYRRTAQGYNVTGCRKARFDRHVETDERGLLRTREASPS
jgi:hypothetical protein